MGLFQEMKHKLKASFPQYKYTLKTDFLALFGTLKAYIQGGTKNGRTREQEPADTGNTGKQE